MLRSYIGIMISQYNKDPYINQPVSWNVIPGFCWRWWFFSPSHLEGLWKPIASPKIQAGYETHYLFLVQGGNGLVAWA